MSKVRSVEGRVEDNGVVRVRRATLQEYGYLDHNVRWSEPRGPFSST